MINKKKRQIMFYQLGYYKGKIDGIWGKLSKEATKNFQSDHNLKIDSIYGMNTESKLLNVYHEFINQEVNDEDFKNIRYFKRKEFNCKCGCGYDKINKQLLYNIDTFRYYLENKMIVTSGCRCSKHNKDVRGATNSRHFNNLKGAKAVDFYSSVLNTDSKKKKAIDDWINYFPGTRYAYSNKYYNNKGKSGILNNRSMGNAVHFDVE